MSSVAVGLGEEHLMKMALLGFYACRFVYCCIASVVPAFAMSHSCVYIYIRVDIGHTCSIAALNLTRVAI